jgi:hypothetical protein
VVAAISETPRQALRQVAEEKRIIVGIVVGRGCLEYNKSWFKSDECLHPPLNRGI